MKTLTAPPPTKTKPIPFDTKLSRELDRAVVACECSDMVRRRLGRRWKRCIERKIWGEK